ncbi:MAG: ribosomal-protein-alanine N-acetyltransferase [Clostridiales bacterium]|nr:ribosomal-protein-alanine N-acetyltransferase [Clostridiales bacterium]
MTKIAPLQGTHIPALAKIERACFPDYWGQETWRASFARPDFFGFVLEELGEIVGYACGTSLFEDSELLRIAVLSEKRKGGLGTELLLALIAEAKEKGAEKMFLEVREGNTPALKLYEKHGFTPIRVRKNYYADGENGVEMVKEF